MSVIENLVVWRIRVAESHCCATRPDADSGAKHSCIKQPWLKIRTPLNNVNRRPWICLFALEVPLGGSSENDLWALRKDVGQLWSISPLGEELGNSRVFKDYQLAL